MTSELVTLEYGTDDFPRRSAKLIMNGQRFFFEVRGDAAAQLQPLLVDGRIADADVAHLVVNLKLRAFSIVMNLAKTRGMAVSIEQGAGGIAVWVGAATP